MSRRFYPSKFENWSEKYFKIIGTSIVRYQTLPPPKTVGRYFDFGLVSVKLNPTWVSKVKNKKKIKNFTENLFLLFLDQYSYSIHSSNLANGELKWLSWNWRCC